MKKVTKNLTFREYSDEFIRYLKQFNSKDSNIRQIFKKEIIKQYQKFSPITNENYSDLLYTILNPLGGKKLSRTILSNLNDGAQIINQAFTWSETDEGHEFWEKLNAEWAKKIYSKEIALKKNCN